MSQSEEVGIIRRELAQLGQAAQECADARHLLDTDRNALYACAFLLQSFYTGAERVLERSLKLYGTSIPPSPDWHRQLLDIAFQEQPGIRPAILSTSTHTVLNEYRRFRHVARTHYGMEMKPDLIKALADKLAPTWNDFHQEAEAFIAFIESPSE